MTKANATRGETEITSLEKRVEERIQGINNEIEGLKSDMAQARLDTADQFNKLMNAIQELQKKEPVKEKDAGNTPSSSTSTETQQIPEKGDGTMEPNRAWIKKVELPTFEGEDPLGWIARAEKFFEIQQVREEEKMRLAFICMEGMAVHWFQFWKDQTENPTWGELTEALLQRFGDCAQGTVYERLATIKQRGSVGDYIQDFELLIAQVKGMSEEAILGYFLAGLRKSVRDTVRIQDPKKLVQAMATARRVEEAQRETRSIGSSFGKSNGSRFRGNGVVARSGSNEDPTGFKRQDNTGTGNLKRQSGTTATANNAQQGNRQIESRNQNRNMGTRFLPKAEHARRRQENLCFSCGGPYGPSHRCPEGSLRVVLLGEDEEVNDEGVIAKMEEETEREGDSDEDANEELNYIELSQFASKGLTGPRTMKLIAIINGIPVLVLIDSGASHNFISKELIKRLGICLEKGGVYNVRLGDGQRKKTMGTCKGVEVILGDYTCTVEALVFDLGGVDLVLGVSWLATLGDIQANWQNLTMQFQTEQGLKVIKGDPSLGKFLISPQKLLKLVEVDAMAMVWNSPHNYVNSTCTLKTLDGDEKIGGPGESDRHGEIQSLIQEFVIGS